MSISEIAAAAKSASIGLAAVDTHTKNDALKRIAAAIGQNAPRIIAANERDILAAEKDNLAAPLLKRLKFDDGKISQVAAGIEGLVILDEPVGKTLAQSELDAGLELYKVCCPIGVI
ncbi:MAG TPA: gamma-glutamyl-phosphate reductase, partial [Phycisphaerales bacterium]|nr:gamma-glutamyl-phosphate reductase [Phycisphaerales bacterium]